MSGLNGLFVRVLLEVDLRLPFKVILVVNDNEECPLLLSYEMLFEMCFYCGRKCSERHSCTADYDNDGCLLMDKIVRGNKTWVSRVDLVSKCCPMADGGFVSGVIGAKSGAVELTNDSGNKGKNVKEITNLEAGNEVFMETEDGEFEQVQVGGNKKMIKSEAK